MFLNYFYLPTEQMPTVYKAKGKRRKYSTDELRSAVQMIQEGLSLPKVVARTRIPRRSLIRAKKSGIFNAHLNQHKSRVFNDEEEAMLRDYLSSCSAMFYGLDTCQARKLAFEFAMRRGKKVPASWTQNSTAGYVWLHEFLKRTRLSLRMAEATSIGRAQGFNKTAVARFYDNMATVFQKYGHFEPTNIWNLDETGITSVQALPKVIAPTGKKQVGQVTAYERGELVTVVGIINAAGEAMPPILVYPRKRSDPYQLAANAPPGTLPLNSSNGWITADLFAEKVLPHFKKHAKPDLNNRHLLFVDNHSSHISVEAVEFCRREGIVMVTFPPHCSHRLQPLDVSVYGPFKAAYNRALNDWMLSNAGQRPRLWHLSRLFTRAFDLSFTRSNIKKGFAAPGIFPFNRDTFCDSDFVPAGVHVPLLQAASAASDSRPDVDVPMGPTTDASPILGSLLNANVTPESIRALPRLQVTSQKNGRKKGLSIIATLTPEKRTNLPSSGFLASRVSKGTTAGTSGINLFVGNSEDEVDVDKPSTNKMDDSEDAKLYSTGDFVIVQVYGAAKKANATNFVAQIAHLMKEEATVFFLRRLKTCFVFPDAEDCAQVRINDIVCRLPHPSYGATGRTKHMLSFSLDLSVYHIP